MSIASVAEGLETARINNQDFKQKVLGKLDTFDKELDAERAKMNAHFEHIKLMLEGMRSSVASEFDAHDRDLLVILDGKAE